VTQKASAYEAARRRGRDELRTTVLDTASRLLAAEGAGALTMRRIATELGSSTTVLYTMFGGKHGLAEALYLEGFERFRRRMESAPPDPDPLAEMYRISWAYRDYALTERNYYKVMFAEAIPGFTPSEDALAVANASFEILIDAARACVDAGTFAPGDPAEIAVVLWSAAHGMVSLELAGHFDGVDARRHYETAVTAATSWFLRSGPDQ